MKVLNNCPLTPVENWGLCMYMYVLKLKGEGIVWLIISSSNFLRIKLKFEEGVGGGWM